VDIPYFSGNISSLPFDNELEFNPKNLIAELVNELNHKGEFKLLIQDVKLLKTNRNKKTGIVSYKLLQVSTGNVYVRSELFNWNIEK
jgi:hypothetical protein